MFFIVCIISTVSYAYFSASVSGNSRALATVITTAHMKVTYAEDQDDNMGKAFSAKISLEETEQRAYEIVSGNEVVH